MRHDERVATNYGSHRGASVGALCAVAAVAPFAVLSGCGAGGDERSSPGLAPAIVTVAVLGTDGMIAIQGDKAASDSLVAVTARMHRGRLSFAGVLRVTDASTADDGRYCARSRLPARLDRYPAR